MGPLAVTGLKTGMNCGMKAKGIRAVLFPNRRLSSGPPIGSAEIYNLIAAENRTKIVKLKPPPPSGFRV